MTILRGVWPIAATPFTPDGEIDYESLTTQIHGLAAGGCHGVILFGYAGEFYKLTDEERGEILRVATNAGDDADIPVFASITAQSTKVATDRARAAQHAGVDGLMLLPPFVANPGEADVREHVESVGRAVSVPVLVQYAPDNTGVPIRPETFADVAAAVPNVSHFKIECNPPGGYITDLLERTDGDVEVLVGSAGQWMVDAFDRGAVGVIPGGGLHELYLQIYEHLSSDETDLATDLHSELAPLLNHIGQSMEMFIHYEKRMLADRGLIEHPHCRAPSFSPDRYYDRAFERLYEPLRERYTADDDS